MFYYKAVEDPVKKATTVQWVLKSNGAVLGFTDSYFSWSKHGRQGAYQLARRRVRELEENDARSRRNTA